MEKGETAGQKKIKPKKPGFPRLFWLNQTYLYEKLYLLLLLYCLIQR